MINVSVVKLTYDNFKDETSKGIVVVDFFAAWCGPCQMLAPIFEELSNELDDVKFGKIDTQEERDLAQAYAIMSIPCVVILKDGKEVDRIVGLVPKEALKERIENIR